MLPVLNGQRAECGTSGSEQFHAASWAVTWGSMAVSTGMMSLSELQSGFDSHTLQFKTDGVALVDGRYKVNLGYGIEKIVNCSQSPPILCGFILHRQVNLHLRFQVFRPGILCLTVRNFMRKARGNPSVILAIIMLMLRCVWLKSVFLKRCSTQTQPWRRTAIMKAGNFLIPLASMILTFLIPVFMPSGMGGALRRKPRSEART